MEPGKEALQTETDKIDDWLKSFGFNFDPFRILNAGEDNQLHKYLVSHETFEALQADKVSFVLAPVGGGKTSFRVRLLRACRMGEDGRRLFPIVYTDFESLLADQAKISFSQHQRAILRSAAYELLFWLAYHPDEFMALSQNDKQITRALLEQNLPAFAHQLAKISSPADLIKLTQNHDITAQWPDPPDEKLLQQFVNTLKNTAKPTDAPPNTLAGWARFLIKSLHVEAVYLLVDGLDSYPETKDNPDLVFSILSPLLEGASEWAKQGLYLKAFLPAELEALLKEQYPELASPESLLTIEWNSRRLSELIDRRLEAAAQRAPASLDMLAYPGIRRASQFIAQQVSPFPRDVIALVERLFAEHVRQTPEPGSKFTRADIEAARKWYLLESGFKENPPV